jgi:hypothetical protein
MTPESHSLQLFLQSNLSHRLTHIKHRKFSPTASTFIKSIFENIINAEDGFDNVDLESSNYYDDVVPKGANYKLCPEKARNHIENMTFTGQTCWFSINGRKITIHLVYEYNDEDRKPAFKKIFPNAYHRIYLLIHLLQGYARKECSQHLSIYLYLTSMKKTLADCDHDCAISQDNANTAFTFSCKRNNEVYLYRKEEWFKVLGHELFHSFGLDFSEYDCGKVDTEIYKIFPIKTDLRLYEAYTELWGELINIMFIAHFSVKSEEYDYFKEENSAYQQAYLNKMLKNIEPLLYQERMFSVFQASKILTHFGMSYDDLYERDPGASKARQFYKENTPVLSYYIIKNILMFHIHDFTEWCANHNESSLEFHKDNVATTIDHFIGFIRKHYQDDQLVSSMDQARTWFLKQENNQRSDKTPIITLRMSLLEK